MNQPPNTPLNADDELREILSPEFLDSAGAKEEHFYPALNKWRKKHELQARIDELTDATDMDGKNTVYVTVWRNGIGFPVHRDERITELKQELEKL